MFGSSVAVPVMFKNCDPLAGVTIPLIWDPDLVSLEAIDFSGSRVEHIMAKSDASDIDNDANNVLLYMLVISEGPVLPGEGLFATLDFRIQSYSCAPVILDTAFIPPAGYYVFADPNGDPIETAFAQGHIDVLCDCSFQGDLAPCASVDPPESCGDGIINPIDAVYLINYAFHEGPAPVADSTCPCLNRGDWNCDGVVNMLDVVKNVNYVYRYPAPGPCNPCECDPYPDNCPPDIGLPRNRTTGGE
jgi:hypothetical protein